MSQGMYFDDDGFEAIRRHQREDYDTHSTASRANGKKRSRGRNSRKRMNNHDGMFRRRSRKFL